MNLASVSINRLFADAVYAAYRKKRYGIKKCRVTYSADMLSDLKEIHKRALEMKSCDRNFCCGLSTIEEKIKTL
jgi:hypothetical protein